VSGEVEYPDKVSNIPSGDSADYLLDDRNINAPLPGQSIANSSTAATDPRQPGVQKLDKQDTALIGGTTNDIAVQPLNYISGSTERGGSGTPERIPIVVTEKNPFSGENEEERSYLKTRTSRNGETVYREVF